MSLQGEQEFPEDDVDYGTGEGAAYGGSDTDAPLFIAPGENDSSNLKDHLKQGHDANKRNVVERVGVIFAKIKPALSSSGWSAVASVVIAVATVLYTEYAHRQWEVMSGQLQEMKDSTKASERAAYASCLSAQLARSTLLEIQAGSADTHKLAISSLTQAAAATRSEAALIKLKFNDLSPQEPSVVGSQLLIENVGKSAAFGVRTEIEMRVLKMGAEPDFIYGNPVMNSGEIGFAYPNDPQKELIYIRDFERNPKKFSAEEVRDLNSFKTYRVIYGRVTYSDIFGVKHWVHICVKSKIPGERHGQYLKCAGYNKMDQTSIADSQPPAAKQGAIPEIMCTKPKE